MSLALGGRDVRTMYKKNPSSIERLFGGEQPSSESVIRLLLLASCSFTSSSRSL